MVQLSFSIVARYELDLRPVCVFSTFLHSVMWSVDVHCCGLGQNTVLCLLLLVWGMDRSHRASLGSCEQWDVFRSPCLLWNLARNQGDWTGRVPGPVLCYASFRSMATTWIRSSSPNVFIISPRALRGLSALLILDLWCRVELFITHLCFCIRIFFPLDRMLLAHGNMWACMSACDVILSSQDMNNVVLFVSMLSLFSSK